MPQNAPIPVMLLVRELGIGGSERQMSVMARALDRSQFEPHVGCFRPQGLRYQELADAGIPILQLPVRSFLSPRVFTAAVQLHRYIVRHRIRLVHSFDYPTALFLIPTLWCLRSAIGVSSQRSHRELLSANLRSLMRITDRLARAVVVNSEQLRRHMIEDEKVAPDRVYLCYNGIDLTTFQPPPQRTRPEVLAGASLVIGVVCALRPEKDLATLIRAFALAREAQRGMRLLIVGDGPCLEEWKALATQLGLRDEVVFVPAASAVLPWLQAIDIFVLPSTSEALSNSLMEAMACGCAVIASRVGGNPELVQDERTGLLFEARDSGHLARCIRRLVENPGLRHEVGERATASMREHFSTAAAASRLGEIYRELLAEDIGQ